MWCHLPSSKCQLINRLGCKFSFSPWPSPKELKREPISFWKTEKWKLTNFPKKNFLRRTLPGPSLQLDFRRCQCTIMAGRRSAPTTSSNRWWWCSSNHSHNKCNSPSPMLRQRQQPRNSNSNSPNPLGALRRCTTCNNRVESCRGVARGQEQKDAPKTGKFLKIRESKEKRGRKNRKNDQFLDKISPKMS